MSKIVQVELPTGEVVHVEVDSKGGDVGIVDLLKLASIKSTVAKVARWLHEDAIADIAPDRCGVEFGVKLTVESGELLGVIAKSGLESTITVKLEWDLAKQTANGRP